MLDDDRLRAIYLEAFTGGKERLSWPGVVHFVVRTTWLRYCDYSGEPRFFELGRTTLG